MTFSSARSSSWVRTAIVNRCQRRKNYEGIIWHSGDNYKRKQRNMFLCLMNAVDRKVSLTVS